MDNPFIHSHNTIFSPQN